MLSNFSSWIDSQISGLQDISYNTSGRFWTGTEVIASLHGSGLDEISVKKYEVQMILIQIM